MEKNIHILFKYIIIQLSMDPSNYQLCQVLPKLQTMSMCPTMTKIPLIKL
jgi:hypothetical protein